MQVAGTAVPVSTVKVKAPVGGAPLKVTVALRVAVDAPWLTWALAMETAAPVEAMVSVPVPVAAA